MTVIHPHPHPLAMTVVVPANEEIRKKFGVVRVEDWDDRVAGLTWHERHSVQGTFPEAAAYAEHKERISTPLQSRNEVVRCHTITTGELVLLHDDWLPSCDVG